MFSRSLLRGGGPFLDRPFNGEWCGIEDIGRHTRPATDARKALCPEQQSAPGR